MKGLDLKSKNKKIVLIDSTLREGEQAAGVFFSENDKIRFVKILDKLGIDIIDCGMPAVSNEEFLTIKKLANLKGISVKIGASIRCLESEIELFSKTNATECFIIVPASDIHIKEKFKMTHKEYLGYVKKCILYADSLKISGIHLAFEDLSRANENFYLDLINELINLNLASLKAFYICDTIGVALPEQIKMQVIKIKESLKNCNVGIGIHCHNDYGLALANTLSAIDNGATYITFTQNGIGERAGNVKFHELIMTLINLKKYDLNINQKLILDVSKLTEQMSAIFLSPIEPIVGLNAFRHESGIHVDGLLKNRKIYEEYQPEKLGRKNEFILGKHSGKSIIINLLNKLFPDDKFSNNEIEQILYLVKQHTIYNKKEKIRKIYKKITNFYKQILGGVSIKKFIKIVNKVKNNKI